jgi:hypothetical protein
MIRFRKSDRTVHLTPAENLIGNISVTGACLNLGAAPKPGTTLTLEMKSQDHTLTLTATVIHVRTVEKNKFQAGIHFVNVPEETRHIIREIVDGYGRGIPILARIIQ